MSLLTSFQFLDNFITNVSSRSMDFITGAFFNLDCSWWTWPLLLYAAIEINFYIVYKYHLVPRANILTEPQPVRAFGCQDGNDRFMLMRRILDRLERTCAATGEDMFQACVRRRFARHDWRICVKLLGRESALTLSAVIC